MRGPLLAAALLLLLPMLAVAVHAADVPLQEGAQVELAPGVNYTVPSGAIAVVTFPGPVKVAVFTGGTVTVLETNNVTLSQGLRWRSLRRCMLASRY